jgi:hypothetical protein|tara:strand:- start:2121 stop:2303 length:183 start_codon:yes stop_codon:yes gene_type:complete
MKSCSICNCLFTGYGNNPEPVKDAKEGQCCDTCNQTEVIPARLQLLTTDWDTSKKENKPN